MANSINQKVLKTGFGLILLCIAYQMWEEHFQNIIKYLFEHNIFWSIYNLSVIIVFVLHTIYVKDTDSYDFKVLKGELPILDAFLNVSTYIAVGSTALALLKGLYLQQFFEKTYFLNFGNYDLFVMLGVSGLLLWFSIIRVYKIGVEVLYYDPQRIEKQ